MWPAMWQHERLGGAAHRGQAIADTKCIRTGTACRHEELPVPPGSVACLPGVLGLKMSSAAC